MLLLGYSILYKEYSLTRFNHQKQATHESTGPYSEVNAIVRIARTNYI